MKQLYSILFSAIIIGLICGFIAFTVLLFFWDFIYALLSALLFSTVIIAFVPVFFFADEKKYRDIESRIDGKLLNLTDIAVRTAKEMRKGKLALTDGAIILYLRDKKPYITEKIDKSEQHFVILKDDIEFFIFVSEKAFYSVLCGDDKLVEALRENGWVRDNDDDGNYFSKNENNNDNGNR